MFTPDHRALRADHRALTRRGVGEEQATQLLRAVAEEPRTYIRPYRLTRAAWARLLAALVQGCTVAEAAARARVSRPWLKAARRRSPLLERQVVEAAALGGRRLRGVARLECPGAHCGTSTGYSYGCDRQRCRQVCVRQVLAQRRERRQALIPAQVRESICAAVAEGATAAEAAEVHGLRPSQVRGLARAEPWFGRALEEALGRGRGPAALGARPAAGGEVVGPDVPGGGEVS